jgi:hypothetical protein
MKSWIIKLVPVCFLSLLFLAAAGQSKSSPWMLDKTVKNVDLYHQVAECNGVRTIFLKFVNNNKYQVNLSWDESFQMQEEADTLKAKERKEILLMPGSILETDCSDHQSVQFSGQQKEGNVKNAVFHYEFRDVKVSPLK